MRGLAIDVQHLTKTYRLGSGTYRTLRESLSFQRRSVAHRRGVGETVYALHNVDLSVDQGTILGVVGANGAGKSTLLNVLARITEPTSGCARTRGRVGALLDVGTGFHPELTGRENVYLNGAILGMRRREVTQRFDEILDFAGVARFIDTPIKWYSSGMRLRLAFAVAAHLYTQILVVDEVLAAGDAEFQRKCLGKMSEFGRAGRTILFVSHDLGAINRLCDRVVWLDHGVIECDGEPGPTIDAYLRANATAAVGEFDVDPTRPVQVRSAEVVRVGRVATSPRRDERLRLRFVIEVFNVVPGMDFGLLLFNQRGVEVIEDVRSDTHATFELDAPGRYELVAEVPPMLAAGDYVVRIWIGTMHEDLLVQDLLTLELRPRPGERAHELARVRAAAPPVSWSVRRLPTAAEGAP